MSQARKALLCAAVFVCAFLAYASSFRNQFLYGDDQNIVTNNRYLSDWSALPKLFTQNYVAGAGIQSNFYRPAQMSVYAAIVHAVGPRPWAFHLASVGFHGLCGVLLFLLLLRLFPRPEDAALCAALAALWTVHPVSAEEIAVTTGLATPAYTAGMLASVLFFLNALESEARAWWWTAAALAAFAFALGAKESAVVLPALLLIAHRLKRGPLRREDAWAHAPFWALAAAYVCLRLTWLNFGGTLNFYQHANTFTESAVARLSTLATVLAYGGLVFVAPVGLAPHRNWPVFTSPLQGPVLLSLAALTAAGWTAWALRKSRPAVPAGLLWYAACYAPFSNLVAKINAVYFDHWLYAPSLGLAVASAALLQGRRRVPWAALAALLTVGFGAFTSRRCALWKDSASYFAVMVQREPTAARNWTNFGLSLLDAGRPQEAAAAFQRAILLQDEFPQSHHDLAMAYSALGRAADAETEFRRALALDSGFYYSRAELARLYLRQGRRSEALTELLALQKTFPADDGLSKMIASLSAAPRR